MSDKDIPFSLCRTFVISVVLLGFYIYVVNSTVPSNSIATKIQFPSDCVDNDGNTRGHLDNWTTTSGSCDQHICYNVSAENLQWKVSYTCDDSAAIFDTSNCQYVSNSSLVFPSCCPRVECGVGVLPNNTPAACSDLSPTFACEFWRNETQCQDSSISIVQFLYNLTVEYCRQTCGYCT